MNRYLFVGAGMWPIVAHAESKEAMRAYVRDLIGMPSGRPLPRHHIVTIR